MSEADLQALVDGVAAELGAAVWLGDDEDRLLAHTAHDDVIDEVRRQAIMNRRLSPEVRAWFEQWGINSATGPIRTPADKKLGILERWCLPVRFRETHLGYMWVLRSHSIHENELEPAIEATGHIAALLYRRRLSSQVDADLLRLLLVPNAENENFAGDVRALATYTHSGPIAVIAAGPAADDEMAPQALSDLALALQRAAEQTTSVTVLAGVISRLGVLLAPLRSRDDLSPAKRLAAKARQLATHLNHGLEIVAAVGGAADLEHASQSYAQARSTFQMIRAMPDLGPIATWDNLGIFRALVPLSERHDELGIIDPRVRGLLQHEELASTAETFLDLAGSVQATAAKLYVHRTTLYQRLERIATLYRLDLQRNGDHRLVTHLGLKLARVTKR